MSLPVQRTLSYRQDKVAECLQAEREIAEVHDLLQNEAADLDATDTTIHTRT